MEDTVTRQQHLDWCKQRALEYLPEKPQNALASMLSDLNKHVETANHPAIELGVMLMLTGNLNTADQVRKFIEGFN